MEGIGDQMVRKAPDVETRRQGLLMLREAAAGMARVFGEGHLHTGYALMYLAVGERILGDFEAAAEHHSKCLAIQRAHLGDDHPHVSNSLARLGWVLVKLDRFEEGERMLREAIDRLVAMINTMPNSPMTKAHRDTVFAIQNLAAALEQAGRATDAEAEWHRAMAIQARADDYGWRTAEFRLAINLDSQEKYDEAEPHYRRVVEERLDTLGPEHDATIAAQEALASFLMRRED